MVLQIPISMKIMLPLSLTQDSLCNHGVEAYMANSANHLTVKVRSLSSYITNQHKGAPVQNPSTPQQGESTYPYNSVDIESVSFNGANYNNSYNHAKWTIAANPSDFITAPEAGSGAPAPWFCACMLKSQ